MELGYPFRVMQESTATKVINAGSCRLLGFYVASVGATGLPVDPTPPGGEGTEPMAPVITAVTPDSGPDDTETVITGTSFGEQGPGSAVLIGDEPQPIVNWTDTEVTIMATQGSGLAGFPLPVILTSEAGLSSDATPAPSFTFAAAREAGKSSKGENKKHRKAGEEKQRGRAGQHAFPAFPSGAGMLLQQSDGKIMVGPVELKAGQFYPINMQCPNGLEVASEGAFDLTLFLVR